MKKIFKNSLWIFFLLITALFLPASISQHAQTADRSIAIAIGFDKLAESQYEVSAEIIVPRYQSTYSQNAQVISATGVNTCEAFNELSTHLGKVTGLSHVSAVVLGNSLKDENIIKSIDMILRNKRVNYNAQLIFTESTAKDVLKKAVEIDTNFIQNLNEIVQYNNNFIFTKTSLISNFYKTYCEGYGATFVPFINLLSNDYDGISGNSSSQSNDSSGGGQSQSSGSEGGESGGQQDQSKQKYLSNDGKTAIVKNGNYLASVESEQMKGFGLLTNESNRGLITVKNVTDDFLANADVVVSIRDRKETAVVSFSKTGIPQVHYTMNFNLKIEDIINGTFNPRIANSSRNYFTKQFKDAFEGTIKNYCGDAINICKTYNADVLNIYTKFDRFAHEKWQKYLKSLPNPDDYLQNVEFFMDIRVMDND